MLTFANPFNVTDAGGLELDGAREVTTAVVGGTTYLFTAGADDDGVSVFSVAANGTLTNVFNAPDNGTVELDGAWSLTTAVIGGATYLFVAGNVDDGVSVFSVAANGALTNVAAGGNFTDDATLELDGASGVATALSGGNRYLIVSGFDDDGISVFSVGATGALTNVANVTDAGALELDGARGLATAIVGGNTYVFVAGALDDGISVFRLNTDGTLTSVFNITDNATLELDQTEALTTAVVGGTTYLFASGANDDGVSVFSVAANGTLTNVFNVTDDATLKLDLALGLSIDVFGGTTFLSVAGVNDDGVSVFSVAANGALTNVANIADTATLELDGALGLASATVGGTHYTFASGFVDDGVSVLNQDTPSGQLWFPVGGNSADTSVGHVNNDGSNATLLTPTLPEAQSSIGIDLPAGYYFSVSTDHLWIEAHRISDNVKVDELQIGNDLNDGDPFNDDIVNALVIDQINEIIYVGVWGQDEDHTGVVRVTYDPLTGDLNNNAEYGPLNGVAYDTDTDYLFTNTSTVGKVTDIRYMALDTNGTATTTDDVLYYSDCDNVYNFAPFSPTNQIYKYDFATGTATQLTSNANAVGGFPTDTTLGNIGPVTVNVADGLIYFMTHEFNNNAAHLWRIPINSPGTLATEIAAPAGHTFSLGDIPTGGLTFDPVTEQLYITVQSNIPQGFTVDEVIQVQLNVAGTAITGVVDFYPLSELVGHTPDPNAHVAGHDFDQLPTFTKTDVGTAAVEQSTAVDIISSPTITDTDNDHLASATVAISGSFTGSGDQFFVLDGVTEKTSGTFGATGITIAQTNDGGGNLTLTFTGYATLAQYQTVLDAVRFRATGDNPTNYGYNDTRILNWTVSDGAQNVPFGGQNTAVTTLSITAQNDNIVNNLPAGLSVNEDTQTPITGITFTDPDVDPANQDITVTFSVTNGTLNVLTNVLNGILASDITGGGQDTNTITITAPISSIQTTIASSGLRYTGNLNFNGLDTLQIVTSDNGHTGTPGATSDSDPLTITVLPQNDTPDLTNVGPSASSIEQIFALLDTDAAVSDIDLDPLNSGNGLYTGSSLTVARNGGANASDDFGFDTTGALFTVSGGNLQSGVLTFGTFTDVAGLLTINFTSSGTAATSALVDDVIQHITYRFSTNDPPASITLTYTFNDGSPANPPGFPQGGGAQVATDTGSTTVNITAVNDEPTLIATSNNPTFTEGGAAADVFSAVTASTIEAGQTLTSMTVTVTNVTDGVNESINFDGSNVILTNGNLVTTVTNGLNVTVGLVGTTATVSFSGAALTPAQLQTLVDGISYLNSSQDPTDANRVVTITQLVDSGANGGPNNDDNTWTTGIASSVNVDPVNDEPTLTATGNNPTFTEDGAAADIYSTVTASTIEAGQTLTSMTLTVTNVINGASEVLNFDGSAVALTNGNAVTTTTNGLNVTVTVAANTATVTFSGAGLSTAALQTLVDGLSYQNTSQNPTDANRVVTITQLVDSGSNTPPNDNTAALGIGSTVNVDAVNDAPDVTAPASYSGAPNVAITVTGITFADVDGNAGNELATFTAASGTFTAVTGGGVAVAGSGTSNLTLTGTTANLTTFITNNQLTYTTAVSQSISVTLNDQGNTGIDPGLTGNGTSEEDSASIQVIVSQPPTISNLNGDSTTFTEDGAPLLLDQTTAATVADPDSTDFNGGNLTVMVVGALAEDALSIVPNANILLSGSTVQYDADGAGVGVPVDIGTFAGGTGGAPLVVTFTTTDATPAAVTALIQTIAYQNTNTGDPNTAARTVRFTVNDGDGGTSTNNDVTVNITPVNDEPTLIATAVNPTFTEGGANADIFSTVTASTVEAGQTFASMTLTVTNVTDGANEILNINGTAVALTNGNVVAVGVGTATVTLGGTTASVVLSALTLTPVQLQTLVDGLSYTNSSQDPTDANRVVTITEVVDSGSNVSPNDNTAALNVASTVNVDPVNDEPTLTATAVNPTFTEGGANADIFSTVAASTVEAGQTLTSMTLTVTNVTDGANEILNINGTAVALTNGNVVAVGVGTATVTLGGTTASVVLSGATLTPAQLQTLVDGLSYSNTSQDPTDANRVVTITQLVDSGSNSAPNDNTATLSIASTVNVDPVNDEPTLTATAQNPTYVENAAGAVLFSTAAASTIEAAQTFSSITLTVANVTDGAAEIIGVNGTDVALTNGNVVATGVGSATVTLVGTTATVVLSGAALSSAAMQTLVNGLTYRNSSDIPTDANRVVTITQVVDSGSNTAPNDNTTALSIASTVNVDPVNDVPVFANLGGAPPSFIENGSAVVLDNNATVSDVELNAAGGSYGGTKLTLARNGGANPDDTFAGTGSLDLIDFNGSGENVSLDGGGTFIGTYTQPGDGTFSITFNSSATAANVASVMQQIVYANAGDNPPTSVQIDWTFDDGNTGSQGTGGAGIANGSVTVGITQVNDAPFLLNVAPSASYSPGSPGSVLSSGLVAGDLDATAPSPNIGLHSATVKIATGFFAGDELFVNLPTSGGFFVVDEGSGPIVTNISVQSNVAGQLVLSGTDSPLHYQLVLDAVSYHSTAADPSNGGANSQRVITWKVSDGLADNTSPNPPPLPETNLSFNTAPVVDLSASAPGTGFTSAFTETGPAIPIVAADVSIVDSDNAALPSATIVLTNAKPNDSLSIVGTLPFGIDSSIDTSVAGKITVNLTGSASLADYQTALGQIRFSNSSSTPDTTDRDITVVTSDGQTDSNVAHATIHVVDLTGAPKTPHDFNGDGKADILWHNTTGPLVEWQMDGPQVLGKFSVPTLGNDWHVDVTGDFNGDGKADLLWRQDTGSLALWQMNGAQPVSQTGLPLVDNTWHIAGAGDFDGDGKDDLLWRNDSGANIVWKMNGSQIVSVTSLPTVDSTWHVTALGDFNGDHDTDILWRNDNGALVEWQIINVLNHPVVGATSVLSQVDPAWHVVGAADFSGDGKADLLWRHDSGSDVMWLMNGPQSTQQTVLPFVDTTWHVRDAFDYDGDGKSDILWRNDNGTDITWTMNGTQIVSQDNIGSLPPNWTVVHHDYLI